VIRVLLAEPLDDDAIPESTVSMNWVFYENAERMALYYRQFPIPDLSGVIQIYET